MRLNSLDHGLTRLPLYSLYIRRQFFWVPIRLHCLTNGSYIFIVYLTYTRKKSHLPCHWKPFKQIPELFMEWERLYLIVKLYSVALHVSTISVSPVLAFLSSAPFKRALFLALFCAVFVCFMVISFLFFFLSSVRTNTWSCISCLKGLWSSGMYHGRSSFTGAGQFITQDAFANLLTLLFLCKSHKTDRSHIQYWGWVLKHS